MNVVTSAGFARCFLIICAPLVVFLRGPLTVLAHAQDGPNGSNKKASGNSGSRLQVPWIRKLGDAHAKGVIVFVHGVLGDPRTTWSNGRSYWPELLTRDQAFDGQDIYVYGYPSPKVGRSFSIDEVAENLRLVLNTDGVLRYKAITFVCHSMGGLVARAFIIKYQSQIVPKVRFLYFFATPTTGSPYAILAATVSGNSQFGQMYPMNSDGYLGPLQSAWLDAHLNLKSYCAYETEPLFGQIIVDLRSATGLCTERPDPIDANHMNIVKPLDTTSTSYRALKSAFEETELHASSTADKAHPSRVTVLNPTPTITATATSEVVARLYMRGMAPPVGSNIWYKPFIQELFYEWKLTIIGSKDASAVAVTIRDSLPMIDRIRITPEDEATVSESTPKWLSGFDEPRKADYYIRTVRFSTLSKEHPRTILLRRSIKLPQVVTNFSEADFARTFDVVSPGFRVQQKDLDAHEQALRIFSHVGILGMWKYSGGDRPPLKTKRDPEAPDPPLAPGEAEATVEVRCKDILCSELVMGQLEARHQIQ